ncbi:hypothetical protein BgiBS90_034080 [Biomphalaria glabrata]|nr:hypothetical protein BgiBS90_034080 [Biomphalaria glabrata]
MEPVGCNETTMRTFTSWSKMSCAVTCVNFLPCAVFIYFSETKTCSLCDSDLIENITFATDKVYSWPYRYRGTVSDVTISNGISIGSVVHLAGYMSGPVSSSFFIRLISSYASPTYPLCVHVFNSQVSTHDSQGASQFISLSTDTIKVNSTHRMVILVAKYGYQIFIDESFIAFRPHAFPYSKSTYIMIGGYILNYELVV